PQCLHLSLISFFSPAPPPTEISTLSLHDALPIFNRFAEAMTLFAVMCAGIFPLIHLGRPWFFYWIAPYPNTMGLWPQWRSPLVRSEEHTSELQSRRDLVCRLLLEKKKINKIGPEV